MLLPRAMGPGAGSSEIPSCLPITTPAGSLGVSQSPPGHSWVGVTSPGPIPALLPLSWQDLPSLSPASLHGCPRCAQGCSPTHASPCPLEVTEMSPGSGHAGGCPSLTCNPGLTSTRGVAMPVASPSHSSHYSHIKAKIGSHLEPTLPVQPIPGDSSPPPSHSVSMWEPWGTSLASHKASFAFGCLLQSLSAGGAGPSYWNPTFGSFPRSQAEEDLPIPEDRGGES